MKTAEAPDMGLGSTEKAVSNHWEDENYDDEY